MAIFVFTDQAERLLPDCTSDQSQDGLLTVLLETENCRPVSLNKQLSVAGWFSEYLHNKIKCHRIISHLFFCCTEAASCFIRRHFVQQLLAAEDLTLAYWSNSRAASEYRRCSVSFSIKGKKTNYFRIYMQWHFCRIEPCLTSSLATCLSDCQSAFLSFSSSTCRYGYLPGLWPAELTGPVVAAFAVPHRWRFSNWSCWRMPAGRWLALRIAIATGRLAPPVAALPGAGRKHSSEPGGQRSMFRGQSKASYIALRGHVEFSCKLFHSVLLTKAHCVSDKRVECISFLTSICKGNLLNILNPVLLRSIFRIILKK